MITIDEMQEMLEAIAEEVPEVFYEGLNGGIVLLPDRVLSPEARHDDLYTLGEYITDPVMGCYIALYYGSFEALFGQEPLETLRAELRETLFHEFTHHLEGMAGEAGLDRKDAQELREYLEEEEGGWVSSPKLRNYHMGRKAKRNSPGGETKAKKRPFWR